MIRTKCFLASILAAASIGPVGQASTLGPSLPGHEIQILVLFQTLNDANPNGGSVIVNDTGSDTVTFGGSTFNHADALTLNFISPLRLPSRSNPTRETSSPLKTWPS